MGVFGSGSCSDNRAHRMPNKNGAIELVSGDEIGDKLSVSVSSIGVERTTFAKRWKIRGENFVIWKMAGDFG